jgi:hypothetical protein
LASLVDNDTELASVVGLWGRLSPEVKNAIVALVKATLQGSGPCQTAFRPTVIRDPEELGPTTTR